MDVTSRILSQNESAANLFAGKLLLVTCALSLIFTLTILLMDTFIDNQLLFSVVLLGNTIRLLLYRYISCNKGKGNSLKWLITIYALIFASTISVLIGEVLYIMFAFPILIMTRYYDSRKVFKTSAITIIWIWIFSFLMIPIGIVTQTFSLYHIAFSEAVTITIQPGVLGLFNAIATAYNHLCYSTIISSIVSLNCLYLFIFIALTFIAAYIAQNGKKTIDAEIKFALKEAEQKSKELDIMNAITENIECFYFIDPNTGSFEFKTQNKNSNIAEIAKRLTQGPNIFENAKADIHKIIFSEDQEQCRKFFSKENMIEILNSGKTQSIELRWIKPDGIIWIKNKALGTTDIEGNKKVVISVEDISHSKEEIERNAVLAGLGNDLDFICYVNTITGSVNIISQTPLLEEAFKKNDEQYSFGMTQSDKLYTFFKNALILEDLPKETNVLNTSVLLRYLAKNKFLSLNARLKIQDHYMWYRIKYSYDPINPNAFVIGLLNIDKQVRTQFKLGEFSAYEKMRIFTEAFSKAFMAAYYVNLQTHNMQIFKQNMDFERKYGMQKNYKNFIKQYINEEISKDDQDQASQNLLPEELKRNLQKKKQFSVTLHSQSNGIPKWVRIDVVQASDKDHAALAFKDITSELEEKLQKEQNLEIIDILSESYSELHYINLAESTEINLTGEDSASNTTTEKSQKATDLYKTFKKLIEEETHPDDIERLKHELSIDVIKQNLAEQKRYNIIFKRKYNDTYKYTEMTIAKPGSNNTEPQGIAIGFVEVDSRYRAELEQQADTNRIMKLAEEFEFIYDVDIDSGEYTESAKNKQNIKVLTTGVSFDHDFYTSVFQNIPILVYQDDQELLRQSISKENLLKRLETEPSFELNYRNNINGKIIWYKIKIVKSGDWTREHRMLMGILNNEANHQKEIEYRKQLQYALTMAQSANRAKTAFLNNMSHDIRTPMNAIIGFTNLATKHIEDKAIIESYLSKIGESSDHLLSLINSVLDMSRIESGKMTICEKEEDLQQILHSLESIIQADIEAKKHQFIINCSTITNQKIICDKLRLSQVFLNIISNSIKYTPENGIINFSATDRPTDKPGFRTYEFRIKDNGIGMSEEFRQKAYAPFNRAQSSTVSGIQGTGLGLSITKSIVEMMGGQIEMNSEESVGTEVILTFDFRIHEKEIDELTRQEDEPILSDLTGKHILLVEDNELNREISQTILEEDGFNIETAENGLEALQKIKDSEDNHYDVILMDVQMPIMDGYECTRQIRNLGTSYAQEIPIIALTANAFEEDKNAALKAGMNDYLTKPIIPLFLKKMLQKHLHKPEGEST